MIEKIFRIEETGDGNAENIGDILVAIAHIREALALKRIVTEDYPFDDFGVNSYMPFMNYLQYHQYETVRRFLLVHPKPVSGGQWEVAANGVWSSIVERLTIDRDIYPIRV